MPGLGDTYLPPVVATLQASAAEFEATLAKVQALLKAYARTETRTQLGADDAPALRAIAEVRTVAEKPLTIDVRLDTAGALAQLEGLRTAARASAATPYVNPYPDPFAPGAKLSAFGLGGLLGGLGQGAGGGGDKGGNKGGNKGGGGGGLLGALGWGGGMFGMAGFGSILSMAGFGAEHLLATGLGVAGSAGGAMLGGGLLGLGAAGVGAVGMGTDMAGLGQAAGDARALYTALSQVQQAQLQYNAAVAQYGPTSQVALTAQQNLQAATANYTATLQSFPAVAQKAVAGLAAQMNTFHTLFNQATGQAEATGANILNQVVQVAEKFLPTIGAAAAQNMKIIQSSMQPLMTWIQTKGLAIFGQLENVFTAHLPMAVHALTQGLELLVKTIGLVAAKGHLGGFLTAINRFLTRMNGADWSQWARGVMKLISIFRTWEHFVVILAKDLWDLFKLTAGVGTAIVQGLTGMLNGIHSYLNSAQGIAGLRGLFKAHLGEIKALMGIISGLAPAILPVVSAYLTMATAFTTAAAGVARFVGWLIRIPGVGTAMGWVAAIVLFYKTLRIGALLAWVRGLGGISGIIARIGGTFRRLVSTVTGVASAIGTAARAFAGWIVAAARAVAAGVTWAVTSIAKTIMVVATNDAGAAATGVAWAAAYAAATLGLTLLVAGVVVGIAWIATHWKSVTKFITTAWSNTVNWVKGAWGDVVRFFGTATSRVVGFFQRYIIHPVQTAVTWVQNKLTGAFRALLGVGQTVFGGIGRVVGAVVDAIKTLVTWAQKAAKAIGGVLGGIGKIGGGFLGGVGKALGGIGSFFGFATGGLIRPGMSGWVGESGPERAFGTPMGTLIVPSSSGQSRSSNVYATYNVQVSVPASSGSPQEIAAAIQTALARHDQQLARALGSGAY